MKINAWSKLGLNHKNGYQIEDLFTDKQYGVQYPTDGFHTSVNATGVVMLKLSVVTQADRGTPQF